ncbi:type IV pilus modification protein PilV [Dyella acidiphila]|uniref:Type IV pilus modification protein PilV n=1 Tax=Dyella acidiphila TaxID=2775866 RepID=A0ABR9GEP7_9GAMM|nr:type IV pilus modification protein PilV [Dyella acidiphila]MBE1162526.1 type IV pilus modification protein PilV [Dyella acidiphila]
MPDRSSQCGVSLIEVLVAMLVLSVGLMGAGGMLAMSARSTHSAYLRSQVTLLAQGMADRMQANPLAVWSGDYDGVYPGAALRDCATGCTPNQLAAYDKGAWSSQLAALLTADTRASIACNSSGLAYLPTAEQLALRPPFGGSCRMTVRWIEQGIGALGFADGGHARQTFAWEFQP